MVEKNYFLKIYLVIGARKMILTYRETTHEDPQMMMQINLMFMRINVMKIMIGKYLTLNQLPIENSKKMRCS